MLAEFIQLPKEGETVGPYLLREILSTSILGSFYQATHRIRHESVLLHVIPEALLRADGRFLQRYKEVVEAQKKMPRCPAMAVVELHQISGNLIVQYPSGSYKSMNSVVLDRPEPLPEDRVRDLLVAMAKGLSEAAKIGQGHFFMTPDFLFVNEDGELRIAGVGVFQSIVYECFERFVSGAVIPISGDRKLSFNALEIMSPEIRNFKVRDPRSDFYCIGMCAYFMLTGTKPVRRWATPTKARKELGIGWDLFISNCLEPKPADRFPHYRAFLKDLENLDNLGKSPQREGGRILRTLNRIPLPKAVENFLSLRFLMFVRLGLLGLAGLLTIWTASTFFQIIFTDFSTEIHSDPIRRVDEPAQANLILATSQPGVQITITGPQSGRFMAGHQPLYLRARHGKYMVQLTGPRLRPVEFEASIRAGEVFDRRIQMVPDFAQVTIQGAVGTTVYVTPDPGVRIFLGSIEDPEGLVLDNRLLKGEHRLLALHPSLMDAEPEPVQLGAEPVVLTLSQAVRPSELIVVSDPPGAQVLLNGSLLGTTPLSVQNIEVNKDLQLEVVKDGYRPYLRSLRFSEGEQLDVDVGQLQLRLGTVGYSVTIASEQPPAFSELELFVDGEPQLLQPAGSLELTEGTHRIRLTHPDYFPAEAIIDIADRSEQNLELLLKPRPARIQPIMEGRQGARFLVEGREASLDEDGSFGIPPGRPVEVQAVVLNHLTVTQSFAEKPNSTVAWHVPLRPIPGPETGAPYTVPYVNLPLVWIDSGSFNLGSPAREFRRLPNEDRPTRVRLSSGFWIAAHEITQLTFERIMRANPSQFVGENLPVDSVSWESAVEFCRRLTEFEREAGRLPEDFEYRLPTEAEWEYAARAGTTSAFSFGERADSRDGNFHGSYDPPEIAGRSESDRYGTLPVGSFQPNRFGLYDVHGNVAEWTFDRYWDRHPGGSVTDPVNASQGRGRTVRGGSWEDSADRVRSSAREGAPATATRNSIGFRIVLARIINIP